MHLLILLILSKKPQFQVSSFFYIPLASSTLNCNNYNNDDISNT
jgi:hypothetical protein